MASEVLVAIVTTLLTIAAVDLCKRLFGVKIHAYLSYDNYGRTPIVEVTKHRIAGGPKLLNIDREIDVRNKAIFIRLSVSKAGIGTLKGCQGHLVDVIFTPEQGGEPRRIYWDSIPLCWSFTESEKIDIPTSVRMMLAICSTRKNSDEIRLETRLTPNHYKFKDPGTYQFKVSISAENALVKVICIDVVWNGRWDKVAAKGVDC